MHKFKERVVMASGIIDGVYEKPVYSNLLKEYVPANPEKVAYAIARGHEQLAAMGLKSARRIF